jgi:hypothetical protein
VRTGQGCTIWFVFGLDDGGFGLLAPVGLNVYVVQHGQRRSVAESYKVMPFISDTLHFAAVLPDLLWRFNTSVNARFEFWH